MVSQIELLLIVFAYTIFTISVFAVIHEAYKHVRKTDKICVTFGILLGPTLLLFGFLIDIIN